MYRNKETRHAILPGGWRAADRTERVCRARGVHPLAAYESNLPRAPESSGRWDSIPLQVEFTASAQSASQFVQSLPLRAEELHAAGLPEGRSDKVPLFINRLIMKKQSPEKLDEVRVWLEAIGFVLRE